MGVAPKSYTFTFKATTTSSQVRLASGTALGQYSFWDNVSVRLAEPDRSVNRKGLQVFGTVQKNPVATGADLVAYSGFSASNYLVQPYNPDLNFGTGDFCVMGWFKEGGSTGVRALVSRYSDAETTSGFNISIYNDGTFYFYSVESGADAHTPTSGLLAVDDNTWHYFVATRRSSGLIEVYIDGKLYSSATDTVRNINTTDKGLRVGRHWNTGQIGVENITLLRISATAPTAEQVAKIYRDEKPLFQEGAQATLHGTSDAVTALAYDDSTDLLHVGTSAGRSVFKGLQRVDNTTDAVGTAISASNGLVVEE